MAKKARKPKPRKPQPFPAGDLTVLARNEGDLYRSTVFAMRSLVQVIDTAAHRAAKNHAEWHDDPSSDDHADFHASAEDQYPRAVRYQALRDLIAYYVGEFELGNYDRRPAQ